MNRQAMEAMVLEAWDRRARGSSDEDSFVEIKRDLPQSDWSEYKWWKLARRIAAAANSARGEPIVFVFENPSTDIDHAKLWARLWKCFDDGVHPQEIHGFEVATDGTNRVFAIGLHTDRSPYVTQVGTGGENDFKPVDFWEVPFRGSTAVRSGRRHDLMRMVLPLSRRPVVETRAWTASFEQIGQTWKFSAILGFRLIPRSLDPCYLLSDARGAVQSYDNDLELIFKLQKGNDRDAECHSLPPPRLATFRSDRVQLEKPHRKSPIRVAVTLRFEPGGFEIPCEKVLNWDDRKSKWAAGPDSDESGSSFLVY